MKAGGFSLIEVLTALGLAALIGLAGTLLLQQSLSAGTLVKSVASDARALTEAQALLRADFAAAVRHPDTGPSGYGLRRAFAVDGGAGRVHLAFTRAGWENPEPAAARSDLAYVEYDLTGNAFTRRIWLSANPVDRTPSSETSLLSGFTSASVRYFDGQFWRDEWPAGATNFPRLVEFAFEYGPSDTLTLLVAAGDAP